MKSKSEILQEIKKFSKEVGALWAIISDTAREQYSKEMSIFCNYIDTTPRFLDKKTPWANKFELYIGIIR